jgi:hypothetical protein
MPCSVDLTRKSLSTMMGNQNCHIEITFQDNVKWLARCRLSKTSSPPQSVSDYILQSEAATMIYLQEYTCVPTPKVFDWACSSDPNNHIGAGYILMEKLEGKPLNWQIAAPAQKERVMQQLVDILLELEKHPFTANGSLNSSDKAQFDIQKLASPATFQEGCGQGPFSSSVDRLRSVTELYLSLTYSGEITAFNSVDLYLAHRLRLDVIQDLSDVLPNQFFLKHPDDKGDHILVDDSFNIVGMIDWEWTQTVSKIEAFCSPCMMWPVADFYKGSNELSTDELRLASIFEQRDRKDLAECVIHGRKIQRFLFALGPESSFLDEKTFVDLFMALKRSFDPTDESWEQWRESALSKWQGDSRLQYLLGKQTPVGCTSDRTSN